MESHSSSKDNFFVQPRDPRWSGAVEPFDSHYTILYRYAYLIDDPEPEKTVLGAKVAPRQCIFCGAGQPAVGFSSAAHAVPATLGNRHLFSNEECDDCNHQYGRECENELANMLVLYRALFGVRGRSGRPKHGFGDEHGVFLGGATRPNEVRIATDPSDDRISFSMNEEEKRFEVEALVPEYRPVAAIRALIRSLWMLLPADARQRHDVVRVQALGDATAVFPFVFIRAHLPAANSAVAEFRAWERKADSGVKTPELVAEFRIGHTVFFWASPSDAGEYLPTLLPSVTHVEGAGEPSMQLFVIKSASVSVPARRESVSFAFDAVASPADGATASLPKKKGKVSFAAELDARGPHGTETIRNLFLRIRKTPHGAGGRVSGPAFGAQLNLQADDDRTITYGLSLNLSSVSLPDARQTLAFLRKLTGPNTSMVLRIPQTTTT